MLSLLHQPANRSRVRYFNGSPLEEKDLNMIKVVAMHFMN
jgi:hypothetical protein